MVHVNSKPKGVDTMKAQACLKNAESASNHKETFWSTAKICEFLAISDRTLRRFMANGRFPKVALKLSVRCSRWRVSTVKSWLREQVNAGRVPFLRVGQRRLFGIDDVRRTLTERASLAVARREAVTE